MKTIDEIETRRVRELSYQASWHLMVASHMAANELTVEKIYPPSKDLTQ